MKTTPFLKPFIYKNLSVAISAALFGICQTAIAATNDDSQNKPTVTLDALVVDSAANDDIPSITAKPMTDKTTSKKITEQLIMDSRDLVRYNPEVTIGEVGRYGSKGYAIQGVDGNRVAMLIDGVRVPDSEVNEFYVPYGYVNDSRFMSDVETLQSVEIKKGADSLDSGNGAIGGAVSYRTKEPEDLIKAGKNLGGYVKTGYTNKNEEFMQAVGLAIKQGKLSGLVNYARREGHELKNHDMRSFDKARLDPYYPFAKNEKGIYGIYPDPAHYVQHATVAKAYFQPTDEHKFGINGSYQYLINHNRAVTKNTTTDQKRVGFDENERTAYGLSYEYTPANGHWLNNAKFDYTNQKIVTVADTYIYPTYVDPSAPKNIPLSDREYRPNYFDTKQYRFEASSLPLLPPEDKAWLGEHSLKFMTQRTQEGYDPYMIKTYSIKEPPFRDFSSLQIPTLTNTWSLSLQDSIYFNPKFSANAGIRYDNYKRIPNMGDGQRDFLNTLTKKCTIQNSPATASFCQGKFDKTIKQDATTWQAGLQFTPFDDLQIGYQAGTGFLMPLVNQMYAGFAMNGVAQVPNVDLLPEESFNQQLSIQKQWDNGYLKLTGYRNKYKNFIDTKNYGCSVGSGSYDCYTYINVAKADSKGIALSANYTFYPKNDKFGSVTFAGQVAHQTGKLSDGASLLSVQPLNGLLSATYRPIDERYSITALGRFWGKKHAKDTLRWLNGKLQPLYLRANDTLDNLRTTDDLTDNKWTFDVFGNVKLSKALSLQAGVYNLTDEKYLPWENLRPMATVGVNAMVRGNGINRYTAPGRNYALSLNYEF